MVCFLSYYAKFNKKGHVPTKYFYEKEKACYGL